MDPEVRFQVSQGPAQNGATLLDQKLDPKVMSFDVMVIADDLESLQTKLAALSAALNPLRGEGHLFLTYEDGTTYWRKCINSGGPVPDPAVRSMTHQKVTIVLTAHDPLWQGTATLTPLITTTTSWIPWFAGDWEIGSYGGSVEITNSGDQDMPFKLVVYGGTGSITNPKITCDDTSEYIKINKVIGAGEWFEINTDENILSATFYNSSGVASNGYPYLDPVSVFWNLPAGGNTITFSADTADIGGYATIQWSTKYVGR